MAAQLLRILDCKVLPASKLDSYLKKCLTVGGHQTSTPVDIFGDCTAAEFAAAQQNTKVGKAMKPNSVCPKLIIHARAALMSW